MQLRKPVRASGKAIKFHVLILDEDIAFATSLKYEIENRLPVEVTIAFTLEDARAILEQNPNQYYSGITSVLNLDSTAFEKVDLFNEFDLPVIALVNDYEDEMRDQLIKRCVVDYVVKGSKLDLSYTCNLLYRIYKNHDIKVLVVDDSKVSRFVMCRELKQQKFTVIEAQGGEDGLRALQEHRDIKLALIDHQMQDIDGVQLVELARKQYPIDELLIIGLSTSADPRLAVKFLKAGANDFISKPFNYEMMLCRINQNLDMLDAVTHSKNLSNTDFLSGLYNRRYFFEQGAKVFDSVQAESAENATSLTVMMMDIDHFKKINDRFGHEVGDEVIKNFAQVLKAYFPNDIVARIGGEEFAVITTAPLHLSEYLTVNAFRLAIENQKIKVKDKELRYTCSVGVTNLMGGNVDEMVAHADKLLYKAKQNGRNQIAVTNV
jgi:diguanylate cyclase (GGDEF)-like protein